MNLQRGRPPKQGKTKNVVLQLHITEDTAYRLKTCAERLSTSRTEVIEMGIDAIYDPKGLIKLFDCIFGDKPMCDE